MAEKEKIEVPVMADVVRAGKTPEYLFWVGCAGAFDARYKKVTRAFAKLLNHLNIDYVVLGTEESCTGDPARRAGNEMLYQMQALRNIEVLGKYQVKKIITICPHCYNIFKHEYPDLGGVYEVYNYLEIIKKHIENGTLKVEKKAYAHQLITYHDPCYLGRANGIYDLPRELIKLVADETIEMKRNRSSALCCGAGGAQLFKEAEKGEKEIFIERTEEALATKADTIVTACPFCMTMLTDGILYKNQENKIKNVDIVEMIVESLNL